MNEEYTKRELDHFFTDFKSQLNRIEEQTRKTNGRTTKNEVALEKHGDELLSISKRIAEVEHYELVKTNSKRISAIEKWMYTVIGALVILAFLIGSNFISLGELV